MLDTVRDVIVAVLDAPIATILVVAGIAFLLLALVGRIHGTIHIPNPYRPYAAVLGAILAAGGTFLGVQSSDAPIGCPKVATTTDWLTSDAYHSEWEWMSSCGLYPTTVEGKNENNVSWFRSRFEPQPATVAGWYSYSRMTRDEDTQRDAELLAQGYKRTWTASFIDGAQVQRFQGIWVIAQQ